MIETRTTTITTKKKKRERKKGEIESRNIINMVWPNSPYSQ